MPDPTEYPDPEKLADEDDQLGWDINKHGRMKDYSTPDTEVEETIGFDEDEDEEVFDEDENENLEDHEDEEG